MFQFRLQRVLELRAKQEQEVASQLAEARGEAERASEAREALERVRSASRESLNAAHAGAATIGELQNLTFVLDRLQQRISDAEQVTRQAETSVARLTEQYMGAYRDRRALDRLKERAMESYRTEEMQADQRHMDSIALSQRVRTQTAATHTS